MTNQAAAAAETKPSNLIPNIHVKWVRFPRDPGANLRYALTRPTAFQIMGSKESGKSALGEVIASKYPKVIDIFGSRDNEGLAWCRSPFADSVLFLKGKSAEIKSQWPCIDTVDVKLSDLEKYHVVISCSAFYSDIREEWYALSKLMNRLWQRTYWTEPWAVQIREAANLLYSRVSLGDSQQQAKNYIIYVMREMRHCGYALSMDSIRWYSVDIDMRTIADYTFIKAQGIEGLPAELRFLYRWFEPFGVMRMGVDRFALVSRKGPIGYGCSGLPSWHKKEKENLLQLLDIQIEYSDVPDTGEKGSSHVGDYEHVRIVQAYFESKQGMEKLATAIGRSSKTVHKNITYHNSTVQTIGECDKCARVKSLLAKQIIIHEPAAAGISLAIEAKPQVATPILDMTVKKQVAESLKTQGIRVTEGFAENEPDIIAWKDGVTPSEIIAVRTLTTLPATINIQIMCVKEVAAAQHYSLYKLRLICFNALTKTIIFDDLVGLTETVTIQDTVPAAAVAPPPDCNHQRSEDSKGDSFSRKQFTNIEQSFPGVTN